MKSQLFLIAVFLYCNISNAQIINYSWHHQIDGISYEDLSSVKVLSNKDIVTCGNFIFPTDFDPGPLSYMLSGSNGQKFFTRYSPEGVFKWAVNFDSTGILNISSMMVDIHDNLYIFGKFMGETDMDPSSDTLILRSNGDTYIFFAKYSGTDGHLIMANAFGNYATPIVTDMAIDNIGNIYLDGSITYPLDFDPSIGNFTLTPGNGNSNVYIAKYDSSGNFANAILISDSYIWQGALACDNSNHLYFGGSFRDTVDIDPSAAVFNIISNYQRANAFLAKFDSNLNFLKGAGYVGPGGSSPGPTDLVLNSNNELVFFGNIDNGRLDFDASPDSAFVQLGNSEYGSFFTRQDTALNYISAFAIHNLGNGYGYTMRYFSTDINNNIYALGDLSGNYDADPGLGAVNYTTTNHNTLLIKYDSTGNYLSSYLISGLNQQLERDFTVGLNYEIYIGLHFAGEIDLSANQDTVNATATYALSYPPDGLLLALKQCRRDTNIINTTICSGDNFIVGLDTFITAGTFIRRLTASDLSDSIVVLNLSVKNIDLNFCVSGNTITSNTDSAAYQWINCDSSMLVNGATSSTFNVPDNSGFKVEISKNGCVDTTDCIQIFERGNEMKPEFAWANILPFRNYAGEIKVRVDKSGNFIIAGQVEDTCNFDLNGGNSNYFKSGNNLTFIFFAKYTSDRNLLWYFAVGNYGEQFASSTNIILYDFFLDENDNIYFTGTYDKAFDIDPGPHTSVLLYHGGGLPDGFVAKFNSSGQFIWGKELIYFNPRCEFTDHAGGVYIGGYYQNDAILEKLSTADGSSLNGLVIPGGDSPSNPGITAGVCDNQNNVHLLGYGEYDSNLQVINPGGLSSGYINWQNAASRINIDCNEQIYYCGNSSSDAGFGSLTAGASINNAHVYDVAIDKDNNFYAALNFDDTLFIGTDTFPGNGTPQFAFTKFHNDGSYAWAVALGSNSADYSKSIDVDNDGNVYIMGVFNDTMDADAGPGVFNLVNQTYTQAFLLKYGQSCAPVDTSLNNDSLHLAANNINSYYQWIDCTTGLLLPGANTAAIPDSASGYYKVIIYQGDCIDTSDCHFASPTTKVDEINKLRLAVFPNPSAAHVSILSDRPLKTATLYTISGINIYEKDAGNSKQLDLDLTSCSPGIYLLKVESTDGNIGWRKIIRE